MFQQLYRLNTIQKRVGQLVENADGAGGKSFSEKKRQRRARSFRILLNLPIPTTMGRRILEGVSTYAEKRVDWICAVVDDTGVKNNALIPND